MAITPSVSVHSTLVLRCYRFNLPKKISFLLLTTVMTSLGLSGPNAQSLADQVDPRIGSAPLEDLSLYGGPNYKPDPVWRGFTGLVYPGASLPHGLVKLSPITEIDFTEDIVKLKHGGGYYYPDKTIVGFAHTNKGHWGTGNFLFMPMVGDLKINPGTASNPESGYRSRFSHDQEEASAGYYSVNLLDYGIHAELTATRYVGMHRYTFPATTKAHVVIDLSRALSTISNAKVEFVDDRHLQGTQNSVHFFAEFSKPFTEHGTWSLNSVAAGSNTAAGKQIGAYVSYSMAQGETLQIKVGLSYVSPEKARANLVADAGALDFNAALIKAKDNWNAKLGRIEVEGGTLAQKKNFYTSLYRAMLWPPVASDADGEYRDSTVHKAEGFTYYLSPPLWDSFRNQLPLLLLLEPEVKRDILKSILARAETSGWMETQFQGNHATSLFAQSFLAGLGGFDIEKAYEYLRKNQTNPQGPLEFLDEFMNKGFIAEIAPIPSTMYVAERASVAKNLEYSFNAWCLAMIAGRLGKQSDQELFLKQSAFYHNSFDSTTGFMRGKRLDGSWITPFDPQRPFFVYMFRESNGWQNLWFVPHDIPGFIDLYKGKTGFVNKLDQFFSTPYEPKETLIDIAGMVGQYNHGNQPDHHAPYLYVYAGQPWKTQALVRDIMDKMYRGNVYVGMDDCGEMAAWYVWSAMGFYPVNPAQLAYPMGSPLFSKITLHLPEIYGSNSFVIEATGNSDVNRYIQSATLNGAAYDKAWLSHFDIIKGGNLKLTMGQEPNKIWASDTSSLPPRFPVGLQKKRTRAKTFVGPYSELDRYKLNGRVKKETVRKIVGGSP